MGGREWAECLATSTPPARNCLEGPRLRPPPRGRSGLKGRKVEREGCTVVFLLLYRNYTVPAPVVVSQHAQMLDAVTVEKRATSRLVRTYTIHVWSYEHPYRSGAPTSKHILRVKL